VLKERGAAALSQPTIWLSKGAILADREHIVASLFAFIVAPGNFSTHTGEQRED
jgi:hypothetical protein